MLVIDIFFCPVPEGGSNTGILVSPHIFLLPSLAEPVPLSGQMQASLEQKEQVMKVFSMWDTSGDGFISKRELKGMLIRIGLKDEDCDILFKAMDTDNDSQISYAEFLSYLLTGKTGTEKMERHQASKTTHEAAQLIATFLQKKLDEDGDSKLPDKRNDKTMFELLDGNRNGQVSISEWISGLRSLRVGGSCPVTPYEFSDEVLKDVFKMIDKAQNVKYRLTTKCEAGKSMVERDAVMEKDNLLSLKEFRSFLRNEATFAKEMSEYSVTKAKAALLDDGSFKLERSVNS